MQFQQEPFIHFFDEALPLYKDHFHEVGDYFDGELELEPDVENYIKLDDAGALRCYTIRSEEKLIGYCIHHIFKHLHFCSSLQSLQDAIFIVKEHRGIGEKFINWVDEQLLQDGIEYVYHYVSRNLDYSPVLKRLGYHKIESTYLRRLD